MAFSQTTDKMVAYRAYINTLLKDPEIYKETMGVCQAIKEKKDSFDNNLAQTKSGNMRFALTLPDVLLKALEKYERDNGGRFFTEENDRVKGKKDMHEFMRRFPEFCRPERI